MKQPNAHDRYRRTAEEVKADAEWRRHLANTLFLELDPRLPGLMVDFPLYGEYAEAIQAEALSILEGHDAEVARIVATVWRNQVHIEWTSALGVYHRSFDWTELAPSSYPLS